MWCTLVWLLGSKEQMLYEFYHCVTGLLEWAHTSCKNQSLERGRSSSDVHFRTAMSMRKLHVA